MAAPETPLPPTPLDDVTLHRLGSLADVLERYDRHGPHLTVALRLARDGEAGDDVEARWNAMRTEIEHAVAPDDLLDTVEAVVLGLPREGATVLVTADDHDAAHLTLDDRTAGEWWERGPAPALIPAFDVLATSRPAVGAIVDRVGGEIYVDSVERIERVASIDGERDEIHKPRHGGGKSHSKLQHHAEVVWDRNAALVAAELDGVVERTGTDLVLVTGDRRAAELVAHRLGAADVRLVTAGGRHEPDSPDRLHDAARDAVRARHDAEVAERVDGLREELGQQDRAVAGAIASLEAISEGRADRLFVDLDHWRQVAHLEEIVRAAMRTAAEIVVGSGLDVPDGVAVTLRYPYQPPHPGDPS